MSTITPAGPAPPPPPLATAFRRRRRYAFQTAALLLAITTSCILLGLLAARFPARIDVTATREHRLSERTIALLADLDKPYEIAIAANLGSLDARAADRTRDVLDTFARASGNVKVTLIDTGSTRGIKDYDELLNRLADRFKPDIDAQTKTIQSAFPVAESLNQYLAGLSTQLLATREATPENAENAKQIRDFLEAAAARARVLADDLARSADASKKALERRVGQMPVPPVDDAIRAISTALSGLAVALSQIRAQVEVLETSDKVPAAVRDRAKPIAASLLQQRNLAALTAGELDRLPALPLLGVARTLVQTSAALVIGPPGDSASARAGITAIDFNSLFPPRLPEGATPGPQLDLRARTEELIATAIASLRNNNAPIVVLMHDLPGKIAPDFRGFQALKERLELHGIGLFEWTTASDRDPPSLTSLDPAGKRPVVFANFSRVPNSPEAAARMGRLADALAKTVRDHKPLLLSVNVSALPGTGDKDPLVEFLPPLGISADSGRPLMQQSRTPGGGRNVATDFFFVNANTDHSIGKAINGLKTHLFGPIPIRIGELPSGTTATPILTAPSDGNTWAESEWLGYARIPTAQRSQVINPPAPDSPRDDPKGPWPVVVSLEHTVQTGTPPQRLVVVGGSDWFLDAVTEHPVGIVDGPPIFDAPGNLELFESAVLWLAGQDELIARSAQARSVPLIPPLSDAKLAAIRWSLIAGLPLLVLLIGASWRLARG